MRNMAVRSLDDVMIVTLNTHNPTDAEWEEAVSLGKTLLAKAGEVARTGAIVFTEGGAPNSKQRQKLRELYGATPPPMALVTDSVIARGTIAVFSIFWPSTNAVFSPADWGKALRHAGLKPERDGEVVALLRAMEAEVGKLAVLAPILATRP
ncbi:MAG: hypothetical protein ACOZQL_40145 [Myxococcota bacterium]